MTHEILVDGRRLSIDVDPHVTLLDFLRARGWTGTKEGCAEGECGACAVAVVRRDAAGRTSYEAVNGCLVLAAAFAGCEVWTVEGIADGEELHPVQRAMVETGGSQCGYCTPGFVISLFSEYYRRGRAGYDPEAISGNLCRCTGYRPIRDAARGLGPSEPDRFSRRLATDPPRLGSMSHAANGRRLHRPATLEELFAVLAAEPAAKIVAGGTDVVVEINQRDARFDVLVSLDALEELRGFELSDEALVIGAAEPLSHVETHVHGVLPMLEQLLPLFSSRLVRNRATFGGNLVNASPIGDGAPALLALDAELVLASAEGRRSVPLDGFFTDYRKTSLRAGEIVAQIRIPRPFPRHQRFYKVSKRELDDIATVAAAFAIDLDERDEVIRVRLAYGGVAATPVRVHAAEDALTGLVWSPRAVRDAREVLAATLTPITDHRGTDAYRSAMVLSLLDKFYAETSMRIV